jgi:hypothetical protein
VLLSSLFGCRCHGQCHDIGFLICQLVGLRAVGLLVVGFLVGQDVGSRFGFLVGLGIGALPPG